jgi:hypothetical protein
VKINCKTRGRLKAHRPEIEIWENLKELFSKTTFYGLHAGNNQNLKFDLNAVILHFPHFTTW